MVLLLLKKVRTSKRLNELQGLGNLGICGAEFHVTQHLAAYVRQTEALVRDQTPLSLYTGAVTKLRLKFLPSKVQAFLFCFLSLPRSCMGSLPDLSGSDSRCIRIPELGHCLSTRHFLHI